MKIVIYCGFAMSNQNENKIVYQALEEQNKKLDRLLDLVLALQSIKSRRIVREADMRRVRSPEVLHRRVEAVETIFHKMLSTLYTKRRDSYKFPQALMEHVAEPVRQAILLSTLINQCSLRKAFKPVAGEGGMSPADIAKQAIEDSNLIMVRIRDTGWGVADTLIVLSPAEAVKSVRDKSKLPAVWKGWTCRERMGITNTAVGPKKPPHDPSGVREWPGIAALPPHYVQGDGPEDDGTAAAYDNEEEYEEEREETPDERAVRIAREVAAEIAAEDAEEQEAPKKRMPWELTDEEREELNAQPRVGKLVWPEDRQEDEGYAGIPAGDPFADIEREVAGEEDEKPDQIIDRKAFEDYVIPDEQPAPPKKSLKIKLNIGSNR